MIILTVETIFVLAKESYLLFVRANYVRERETLFVCKRIPGTGFQEVWVTPSLSAWTWPVSRILGDHPRGIHKYIDEKRPLRPLIFILRSNL